MAPVDLPGKGLAQHPFFYAGEDKVQSMFVVKEGKIAWSHTMPNSKGEISDAFFRANGNILFAHQFGITEISPQKTIVWHLDAPRGCEIHTAQPLAGERVMYVQNGDPARSRSSARQPARRTWISRCRSRIPKVCMGSSVTPG